MSTEQPTNTKVDAGTGGSIKALLDALEREAVSTRAIIQDAWGSASYGRNPSWVKVSKIRELAAALLTRRDQPEIPMLKNAEGRDAPRRCYLDLMTPAELAIRAACLAVEEMPADVRLTDAVVLLGQAKDAVADFVDGIQATRRDAPQERHEEEDHTRVDRVPGGEHGDLPRPTTE